ncbi:TM2 domain-containing protein 3 isoform X4 [Oryctolagus cuniculus]|uniref:TM2 domain-containing protein 3 isoform X4 n=1 Tax=Oryctolagus cuniculus TaxID=9986 RepID=UPI00387A7DDE
MAAAAGALLGLGRLWRLLLFLSQFCVLSGGEHSQPLAQPVKDAAPTRAFTAAPRAPETTEIPPYVTKCPSNGLCSRLPADCIDCATNFSCVYGKPATFDCAVKPSVTCVDRELRAQESFVINMTCRFCWQLPETDYECTSSTSCMAVSCPRQRYAANCTVRDHIHCLGEPASRAVWEQRAPGLTLPTAVAASPWAASERIASTWASGGKASASSSASGAWASGRSSTSC